jgi:hypothetical protein
LLTHATSPSPVKELYGEPKIAFEGPDPTESPTWFVAITENEYVVPGVNPVIATDLFPGWETVPVIAPGEDVTVYEVIALPPLLEGASKVTVTDVSLVLVATTAVGASGTLGVVTELDSDDNDEVPTSFVAVTQNT